MSTEALNLLDKIKKQIELEEKCGKEIAQDFHITALNYNETKLLLDYVTMLEQTLQEANDNAEWWLNRFKALQKRQKEDYEIQKT